MRAPFLFLTILLPALLCGADAYDARAAALDASFAVPSERGRMDARDLGLVNGKISLNGWVEDVAEVRQLFAPPYFCADFRLNVDFNGRKAAATRYTWRPEVLLREGAQDGWMLATRLYPIADARGALLKVTATNANGTNAALRLTFGIHGTAGYRAKWKFNAPKAGLPRWEKGIYSLESGEKPARVALANSFGHVNEGVFADVPPGESRTAYFAMGLGDYAEADDVVTRALADPEGAVARSVSAWRARVARLAARVPHLDSDNAALVNFYRRSLLHFPLTEWNVDEFVLKPFYATGGMFGVCMCSYLWNIGGPYRMWPLVDPAAIKAHLKAFLKLDLMQCYALNPCDGGPVGPYYPINQEKMIFMIRAYVLETADVAFLREVISRVVAMALEHDDLTRPAVIADYGAHNDHLEIRKGIYDGEMPDLNLRRIVLLHLADELCKVAGYDPKVDLLARADALKALCRERFWNPREKWFCGRCSDGVVTTRWTIQMFKALGWGDWVLDAEARDGLLGHLMDESEFLGSHGVHSLSKKDPAYDDWDVDNGGPGACVSFAPAVAERLYADGRAAEGWEILRRLLWLGDGFPYWCDSHYADRPDYRHNTPLQLNIEGGVPAQAILFGLCGLKVNEDFSVTVAPRLPAGMKRLALSNVRLGGHVFDFVCTPEGTVLTENGRALKAPPDGALVLPAANAKNVD